MRVSSFSRLSVIAISIFAITFVATMYQVGASLTSSRSQYSEYQILKTLTTVKFYRTVATYLQTGDASLINVAQRQLNEIITQSARLNVGNLSMRITEEAAKLNQHIETKYRAMGKLSGDPLALIRHGEQSMAAITHSLIKYSSQSSALNQQQRVNYLITTGNIASSLNNLINTREKLFLNQNMNSTGFQSTLKYLMFLTQKLSNYPSLAIFPENEGEADDDDFFNNENDEKEDISEEAIAELTSLINRYQSEFEHTLTLQNQRTAGLALLKENVTTLENIILVAETVILQQQEVLNQQLYLVVMGLLSFLICFLVANYWLQRSVILQPLRKLRDGFLQLVEQGKVDNITDIPPKTELGEISSSFNTMVNRLAQDDKAKAQQLDLVAKALTTMECQVKNIYQSSKSTSSHVQGAREIMDALGQATETVNTLSERVVHNAQATQQAMETSQSHVAQVLAASESTSIAAQQSKSAITSLFQSVDSVTSIVDVISAIADQTNLLALNAAIEAARAGEHGRGFSVVADEVRQLAGKTQDSLKQISQRLDQLHSASNSIEKTIVDIEIASHNQKTIADQLQETALEVTGQAKISATVAQDSLTQITLQRQHFISFERAMCNVDEEVNNAQELANIITIDVNNHVHDIGLTLEKRA
ncbi:MAG: HAMP domain-containing protein [Colwellia sp.]|nr:HAMP domain-containing protein [Colwellia sp.]